MAEDLEVDVGYGGVDPGDLGDGELAREGHAVGSLGAAPGRAARVVDVRLRRDMRLDAGHGAADLEEQPPVLDDERVGAQGGAAAHELERRGHLAVLDDDVHGDIDACTGEMGRATRLAKRVVGEVRGLATSIELAHAAVDGVGACGERGGEGLRPAGGGQELGFPDAMSGYLLRHALPFENLVAG